MRTRVHPGPPRAQLTTVYLVCFHSAKPTSLRGSTGQYLTVETAIQEDKWPYDNGDDPSFYVARRGGPLTWGVCRQDLRNSIAKDSIVVFFSFTPAPERRILYRLCGVASVSDKVDHRAIHNDLRFEPFRHLYINGLIVPKNSGWFHDESDRRTSHRHRDWLWRIADKGGLTSEAFRTTHATIYEEDWFSDGAVPLGRNYVVFSCRPDETLIVPHPPTVAVATNGQLEVWTNPDLRALTLDTAARCRLRGRSLRTKNPFRPHRQIRFDLPADEASRWRDELFEVLRGLPDRPAGQP